jgi:hypothetical protein
LTISAATPGIGQGRAELERSRHIRTKLDEWRSLRDEGRRMIAALQLRYAGETAISALKIRHNNVIGYYIEVSANHAGKLGPEFIPRQTMAGAQRYTTTELADLETKIASAAERALALELRLYEDHVGEGHCQLSRPWYARCVGGAAARVGRTFARPLCCPALRARLNQLGEALIRRGTKGSNPASSSGESAPISFRTLTRHPVFPRVG